MDVLVLLRFWQGLFKSCLTKVHRYSKIGRAGGRKQTRGWTRRCQLAGEYIRNAPHQRAHPVLKNPAGVFLIAYVSA